MMAEVEHFTRNDVQVMLKYVMHVGITVREFIVYIVYLIVVISIR